MRIVNVYVHTHTAMIITKAYLWNTESYSSVQETPFSALALPYPHQCHPMSLFFAEASLETKQRRERAVQRVNPRLTLV